jgi:hypothetical protein
MVFVVAHSKIGDIEDAGVVRGDGDLTECVTWFPVCGCDAGDSGSQNELDHLDTHFARHRRGFLPKAVPRRTGDLCHRAPESDVIEQHDQHIRRVRWRPQRNDRGNGVSGSLASYVNAPR